MQKKILILGLGAFGFAVAKHLGENNPEQVFYASEVNPEIYNHIKKNRQHPYFFQDVGLPQNIKLVGNEYFHSDAPQDENIRPLHEVDIIISIIPCQFVGGAFSDMKDFLKDGVTILNLSKGIDNTSLQTVSEKLSQVLCDIDYNYAYLAGGMIAQELVEGKKLGADIVTGNKEIGKILKNIFTSETLEINLKIGNPKNTELYAALKNIVALILGYYEGKGSGASTLGYYFSKLIGEMMSVIEILNSYSSSESSPFTKKEKSCKSETETSCLGEQRKEFKIGIDIDFTDYALSGDLIATCFGASRNRLLGNILGKGKNIQEALGELKTQNKIAEGYETLKGVYKITQGKDGFEEINKFGKKYL